MLIERVKELKPLERFVYWVRERQQILRKKRASLPKPWSDDTIFQSVYFTNVHREDDKVTTWFRDNIREPLRDKPEVIFATIAFRWFNWPATGERLINYNLLEEWDLQHAVRVLEVMKSDGEQVFTGAFNISNSGSTKPKIDRVCEDYIQPVWEQRDHLVSFLTHGNLPLSIAHRKLMECPGLGGSGFMAAQVVADLKYTNVLKDAPDWWTWCSPGPGSKRGMNRVLGLPEDNPLPKDWEKKITELRMAVLTKLRMKIHAQDLQNCLCEFSKYERMLWGEGRSKRKYQGV